MNLVMEKVILRAVEKEDLELLHEMINSPTIENMVVGWNMPISKEKQEEWYKSINDTDDKITYTIEYEGKAIGMCTISNIDWKNRNANIGIKICDDLNYRNKGIGTLTVKIMLKYCFEELGLNRVYTSVLEYNIPSQKLFEKCGFILEGRQRESIYKNNKYNDLLIYGMLKKEYLGVNND